MKLSEAAAVLNLDKHLTAEWMNLFSPIGGGRFAAYNEDASRISPELREALGDRLVKISGRDFDGLGVEM